MGSLWLAWRNHDFKENFKLEAHLIQYPPSSRRMWDCIFKKWGTISGSIDEWAREVGPWNWRLDQIWVSQAFRSELKSRHACSPGLWEEWSLGSMVMSNWWCRKICPRARGFGQWSTGYARSCAECWRERQIRQMQTWLFSNQQCTLWGQHLWVWISLLSFNSCLILGKWQILQASLSLSVD